MDASEVGPDEGVMIAFLPGYAEWADVDLPHMTLVYAGSKSDLGPNSFSDLAKDASTIAMFAQPFNLRTTGIETFGPPEDRVDVLRLRPIPELLAARRFVERWNKSEHDFAPHVTIGPHKERPSPLADRGEDVPENYTPRIVSFNRLYVGWGAEHLIFRLGRGY